MKMFSQFQSQKTDSSAQHKNQDILNTHVEMYRPAPGENAIWFYMVVMLLMLISGCSKDHVRTVDIESIVRTGNRTQLADLIDGGAEACGGEEEYFIVCAAFELKRERFENALREIAKVNPKGRFRTTSLWIAGESLFRKGNIGPALPLLSTLVRETPNHLQGRKCLAALYYDLGAMEYVEEQLQYVCEMDQNDYRPHLMLGRICLDYERFAESITHLKIALERDPPEAIRLEIKQNLTLAMCGSRQYEQLLESTDTITQDPIIQTCRAEALWATGKSLEARQLIDRILTEHPDSPGTLLLSARVHVSNRNPNSAIPQLVRIIQSDPHNLAARLRLAEASRLIGDETTFKMHMQQMEESQALVNQLVNLNNTVINTIAPRSVYLQISEVCEKLGKKQLADRWREVAQGIGSASPSAVESDPAAAHQSY